MQIGEPILLNSNSLQRTPTKVRFSPIEPEWAWVGQRKRFPKPLLRGPTLIAGCPSII